MTSGNTVSFKSFSHSVTEDELRLFWVHVDIYVYVRKCKMYVNLIKTPVWETEFPVRYNITLQEGNMRWQNTCVSFNTVDTHFEIASSVLLINYPSS